MDMPPPNPPIPHVWKAENIADWELERPARLAAWKDMLGHPKHYEFKPEVTFERDFNQPEFRGKIYLQRSGPDTCQQLLVLEPVNRRGRRPAVVIPFYAPDRTCGYNLTTGERLPYQNNRGNFALHLVSQGYVVICGEAYPRNLVPQPADATGIQDFRWWRAAADVLNTRYPEWTGMGKLYADAVRMVDFAATLDAVDPEKITAMGHSLGGKIAFYLGCLDPRVKVMVCSDFGMPWDATNWSDPWYFGDKLPAIRQAGFDHAELLALAAPRPFILIGGQYDLEPSRPGLDAARRVYDLYGAGDRIYFLLHATGHAPSWDSLESAYKLLAENLQLPPPDLTEFHRQKALRENAQ